MIAPIVKILSVLLIVIIRFFGLYYRSKTSFLELATWHIATTQKTQCTFNDYTKVGKIVGTCYKSSFLMLLFNIL
jgi:hypothetical protein